MRDQPNDPHSPLPRLVSAREVQMALGVSSSTLWRMVARGEFPKQTEISAGRVGWLASDVADWIAKRFNR
jgi:prophage regulatory protein